jgi:hypothetical protein
LRGWSDEDIDEVLILPWKMAEKVKAQLAISLSVVRAS